MKQDAATWTTLEWVGLQVIEALEDEPEERMELRNCGGCGSTLCVRIA